MTELVIEWPMLLDGEVVLTNGAELLWRQVNPQFVHHGQLTSQAFRPSSRDAGRLSVSRATRQTAEGAHHFYVTILHRLSCGTWAVSVDDVHDVGSRSIHDEHAATAPPPPCPPGHTSIDLRPFGQSRVKKMASKLSLAANRRGRQYPFDSNPGTAA